MSPQDYIAQAPPEIGTVLRGLWEREQKERETLIKNLINNAKCGLTSEELKGHNTEALRRLAHSYSIEQEDDYSGFGGGFGGSVYANESDDPNDQMSVPDPPRWMTRRGELPKDLRSKE